MLEIIPILFIHVFIRIMLEYTFQYVFLITIKLLNGIITLGGFEFFVGKSPSWQESIQPSEGGCTLVCT